MSGEMDVPRHRAEENMHSSPVIHSSGSQNQLFPCPARPAFQGEGPRELSDQLSVPKNDLTKGNQGNPQQQKKSGQGDFFNCC